MKRTAVALADRFCIVIDIASLQLIVVIFQIASSDIYRGTITVIHFYRRGDY
jgi:hypothetical protein